MIRTYVTTIPLQGRFDLAVNQYQSPDNAETLQTRFPIIQVIKILLPAKMNSRSLPSVPSMVTRREILSCLRKNSKHWYRC